MATEVNSYEAFSAYPVTGPLTGPTRRIDDLTRNVRVILSGTAFSVRVQVSNAPITGYEHTFTVPELSWETAVTLTSPDAPYSVPMPARWVRLIVDSGTVTGGSVAESRLDSALLPGDVESLARTTVSTEVASRGLIGLNNLPFIDARTQGVSPLATGAYNVSQLQALIDAAPDGSTVVIPAGTYNLDAALFISNKQNFTLDATGATFKFPNTIPFAVIVHGGNYTRTAAGATLTAVLLEQTFEATTPCKNVTIKGLTTDSQSGARATTNVMLFYADDCALEDVWVKNSQGAGVELRQCVRPSLRRFTVTNWATYGMFIYQSHGLRTEKVRIGEAGSYGGRAWEVKQRHKFFSTLDHEINAEVINCVGFPAPGASGASSAWCTGGVSYNDIVTPTFTEAAAAARNYTGHHLTKGVKVNATFITTTDADPLVKVPEVHVGPFCDRWELNISIDGAGRTPTAQPLIIGTLGTNGAPDGYGQNHVFRNMKMQNIVMGNGGKLIDYGVSFKIDGFQGRNLTAQSIISQNVNDAVHMPFGQVDSVEFLNTDIEINLLMAANGEQGLRVLSDTKVFTMGGNKLTVTPTDNGSNNICNPAFIRSDTINCLGNDSITVLANPASVNHAITYGFYSAATRGTLGGFKFNLYAPTTLRGLVNSATTSTKALRFLPSEFIVGATTGGAVATGEKTAFRTDGLMHMPAPYTSSIFTGAWTSPILDNSDGLTGATGKKVTGQTLRDETYSTALPTTGTYSAGDKIWKTSLGLGDSPGWVCYRTGTYGSGTDPLWNEMAQSGLRKVNTGAPPTFSALYIGEEVLDTVKGIWYKAVTSGSTTADWKAISREITVSTTLTPGAIAANSSYESADIAISGVIQGDHILVDQVGVPDVGIIARAHVRATGQVRIRLYNVTAAAVTPTAGATWKLTAIRASS